jgi:glutaminyl-tRNA synthetase
VRAIRATVHADTIGGKNPSDGRKVSGVIHWVDAGTSVTTTVRLYDRLFKSPKPEEGGANFLDQIDPNSLATIADARLEASLANAAVGSRWQLERVGYFIIDTDRALNRIITLKDERAVTTTAVKPPAARNPKAQKRPKGKSPAEYRVEARARDESLARDFARITEMVGAESADLLAGDRFGATFFLDTLAAGASADVAAKWMINELPRALGDRELEDVSLPAAHFAALLKSNRPPAIAKAVLAEMVATGKAPDDTTAAKQGAAVGVVDIEAAVQAVITANPEKVAQYKAGKTGLLGFFVGQVMKSAPGANPNEVNEAVRARLA